MKTQTNLRLCSALTFVVGAGILLAGCNPDGPTATVSPKSHEQAIDVIKNNPNMPQAAKDQAIARMAQEDKAAGFLPKASGK